MPEQALAGRTINRRRPWPAVLPRWTAPYLMFLPAGLLLLALNFFSSAYGVYLSFLDFDYFNIDKRFAFVGLEHYRELIADPVFWAAAKDTLTWVGVVVPASFLLGLYFALLLNEQTWAKATLRTLLLVPWITPVVVVAILWAFMLSPGIGPVNDTLVRLGATDAKYSNWLGDPDLAFPVVMAVQVWVWTPFFAVTLLAGLQAIPKEFYEAAKVDGGGALTRFRFITLPMLTPVILVVLLQGVIWSTHNFTLVFIMTGGGPIYSSEVLTTFIWRTAFPNGQLGEAAAAGTLLTVALGVVGTIWVTRILRQGLER